MSDDKFDEDLDVDEGEEGDEGDEDNEIDDGEEEDGKDEEWTLGELINFSFCWDLILFLVKYRPTQQEVLCKFEVWIIVSLLLGWEII